MVRQSFSGALFDDSLWPLLLVRLVGESSPAQHEEYLDRLASYLQRGERYLVVLDAIQLSNTAPADWRRRQVEWMDAHATLLRELRLGIAFVSRSPYFLLAMRALIHLKPLSSPYVFASTLDEAVDWAAGRFEEVGHPLQARRIREHFGLGADLQVHSTG